jgi:hypothetical protein
MKNNLAIIGFCVIILTLSSGISDASSSALVPKQVIKHGLMEFIKELTDPSPDNLCFVFFKSVAEGILDDTMNWDEAFETVFNLDLTHTMTKDKKCQEAFKTFNTKWQQYQKRDTKVFFLNISI